MHLHLNLFFLFTQWNSDDHSILKWNLLSDETTQVLKHSLLFYISYYKSNE